MRWWPQSLVLFAVLSGLALTVAPQPARAQNAANANKQKVSFQTADGVTIVGAFYKSAKANAPCVLLLHTVGKNEDSKKNGWDDLAKSLQDKGYAVLSFDFRGHGDSTTVDPQKFWSPMFKNGSYVKGDRASPEQIRFEQFNPGYYQFLVNDISAAKAFLDRKNDSGEINTSALTVIGAETGATLGAIWLNSEWYRYKYFPADFQDPLPMNRYPRFAAQPEGKGNVAAIWLSISPKLGTRTISLPSELNLTGKVKAVPMAFLYGAEDAAGKTVAMACEKAIKGKEAKYQFTGSLPIAGAEKLTGRGLLQKSLGTDTAIINWLDKVLDVKTPEWVERDFRSSLYAWGTPQFNRPPLVTAIAKGKEDDTIRYNTYESFIYGR